MGVRKYEKSLTVRLTTRQFDALNRFTQAMDQPTSVHVRALVTASVPSEYWEAEPPPHPDQLSLEDTDDTGAARP